MGRPGSSSLAPSRCADLRAVHPTETRRPPIRDQRHRPNLYAIASCQAPAWVAAGRPLCLIRNCGTGKTHAIEVTDSVIPSLRLPSAGPGSHGTVVRMTTPLLTEGDLDRGRPPELTSPHWRCRIVDAARALCAHGGLMGDEGHQGWAAVQSTGRSTRLVNWTGVGRERAIVLDAYTWTRYPEPTSRRGPSPTGPWPCATGPGPEPPSTHCRAF